MRWAILVLAVSLLVGWTSTAAAECAWVLWVHTAYRFIKSPKLSDSFWLVDSGYPSNTECAAARDRRFRDRVDTVQAQPDVRDFTQNPKNAAFGYTEGRKDKTISYICLPDTIDPRERKE